MDIILFRKMGNQVIQEDVAIQVLIKTKNNVHHSTYCFWPGRSLDPNINGIFTLPNQCAQKFVKKQPAGFQKQISLFKRRD
jgi:hypothetical protein